MPTAKTLSAAQLLVLTAAARRPDRTALPLPTELRVRGGAKRALLASLLERGLVEEHPADEQAAGWRRDGEGRQQALRLTAAGLAAVGGAGDPDRPAAAQASDRADGPVPASQSAGASGADHRGSFSQARNAAPTSTDASPPAAAASALAPPVWAAAAAAADRPAGKLGRVLDAVAAEDGATLAELAALTGWQPHTTRAALTRLRQRGFTLLLDPVDASGGRKAYRVRRAVPA
jgi:DNA-binding MarR family transcriptional regulator